MPSTTEMDLEGATQTRETEAEKLEKLREEKEKPLRERINRMQEDVRSYLLRAGYFHERIEELSQSISSPADKAKFLELQEGLMSRMFETVEALKQDLQQLGVNPEQLTEIKRSEESLKRYGYSEKAAFKSRLDLATQSEKERLAKSVAFRQALEGHTAMPEAPSLEATPAEQSQTEPAPSPIHAESSTPTEETTATDEQQGAETTAFNEKKKTLASGWDEQTDKQVFTILSSRFQEVQDMESYATFVVTRLDKRAQELMYKAKKLRTKIENATSDTELVSIEATKQRLLTKLKDHLSNPSSLRPSASEMLPVEDDTEIPDIGSVTKKFKESAEDEEWDDDDAPYEAAPEMVLTPEQKRENYFNKFDEIYSEFQQVAMRATPEARKNLDEIFADFIAYENADPEAIPAPLKQALLDAALEAYKTANKHEFSHAKFYSLSKDERESTGANTLNHIAGHLNLRTYLIEKTSLPPAKPVTKPKPKVKVTPKPVQAESQPTPQPRVETKPAPAPTPEVKPAEAAAAANTPEQTETQLNPELLRILDTLREATGLTTLDQPQIKQLYTLFQTQGDPKTWHQGIKDEIVTLTDDILFNAGIDPKPKVVWNEKVARLKTLDVSSALYRNKGIDQQDIEYLLKHQDKLQRKLLPDDNASLTAMSQLRQTMGMPEIQFTSKISPADVESMLSALARKVKREPKTKPVESTTSAQQGSSFAQKVAEKISQHEQKKPQDAKTKALDILEQLNSGNLNGQQARARLMNIKDLGSIVKEIVGERSLPTHEMVETMKLRPKEQPQLATVNQLLAYNYERTKNQPDPTTDAPEFLSAVLDEVPQADHRRVKELFRLYQSGLISPAILRGGLDSVHTDKISQWPANEKQQKVLQEKAIARPGAKLMKKYETFAKAKRAGLQPAAATK